MNEAVSELVILKHHYFAIRGGCQVVPEVSLSLNKGEGVRETEVSVAL